MGIRRKSQITGYNTISQPAATLSLAAEHDCSDCLNAQFIGARPITGGAADAHLLQPGHRLRGEGAELHSAAVPSGPGPGLRDGQVHGRRLCHLGAFVLGLLLL
eukprot:890610-Prorocentrum_minimum.AAC.1